MGARTQFTKKGSEGLGLSNQVNHSTAGLYVQIIARDARMDDAAERHSTSSAYVQRQGHFDNLALHLVRSEVDDGAQMALPYTDNS